MKIIQYKHCEFKENIWPMAVWKAVNYLMSESTPYKELSVQIDTTWLETLNNNNIQCVNDVVKETEIWYCVNKWQKSTGWIYLDTLLNENYLDSELHKDGIQHIIVDMDTRLDALTGNATNVIS